MSNTQNVQQSEGYAVDVVFCIDVTESMQPFIEEAKAMALEFDDELSEAMANQAPPKKISQLRVRAIGYRDVRVDDVAFEVSDFFNLPAKRTEFTSFITHLVAEGGGHEPESGLEALAEAIHSPWETGLLSRRHVVVVFTDASAHELGTREIGSSGFRMPASLDALHSLWGDEIEDGMMEFQAKRLLLFAPAVEPWTSIRDSWENNIFFPSRGGQGLADTQKAQILNAIAGSI